MMTRLFFSALSFLFATLQLAAQQPDPLPNRYGDIYTGQFDVNSVRVFEANKPISDPAVLLLSAAADVNISTQYLDGLGRLIQSVVRLGSPTGRDLVSSSLYDAFGREVNKYLPFVSSENIGQLKKNAFQQQKDYYNSIWNGIPGETSVGPNSLNWAYSKTAYENSPLTRIKSVKPPGASWIGNSTFQGVQNEYVFNETVDAVRIWDVSFTALALPTSTSSFNAKDLSKTVVTDANGYKKVTYTDRSGKLVLLKEQAVDQSLLTAHHDGWRCTYYVYDLKGQLRTEIPPRAVEYLAANNWVLSQQVFDELCFSYVYDQRGRVVISKSPGSAPLYCVYDLKDRPVFFQDGNLRLTNEWVAVIYDHLDRVVSTGKLSGYTGSRTALSDFLSGLSSGYDAETTTQESVVPAGGLYEGMAYYYYDDYSFSGVKSKSSNYSFPSNDLGIAGTLSYTDRVSGLLTGSKIKVLDGSGRFLYSTIYYGEKNRPVQLLKDNIRNGQDIISTQYNFKGEVISLDHRHSVSAGSFTSFSVVTKFDYSAQGYLLRVSKNFNNTGLRPLCEYVYDDLGRLASRKLAPGQSQEDIQQFTYGVQGNLVSLNEQYTLDEEDAVDSKSKLFGYHLGYDDRKNIFDRKKYDGSIGGNRWRSYGANILHKYEYDYDRNGQVSQVHYKQKDHFLQPLWSNADIDFSSDYGYDRNGNILSFRQKGMVPGEQDPVYLDDLTFDYGGTSTWSNKLKKVTDGTTIGIVKNGLVGDFRNAVASGDTYSYDANGNLLKDETRLIKSAGGSAGIHYNTFLDALDEVTIEGKGTLEYIYDGEGALLLTKFTPSGGSPVESCQIAEFSYKDNVLEHIAHEEGRLRIIAPNGTIGDPAYLVGNINLGNGKAGVFDYFIKDHIENIRVVFTEELQKDASICTMEDAVLDIKNYEEGQFGQVEANGAIASGNEVVNTRVNRPSGWTSNTSAKVAKLNNSAMIGPNAILKVMAGDKLNAMTSYYYQTDPGTSSGGALSEAVITSLLGSLNASGVSDAVKAAGSNLEAGLLTGSLPVFANQPSTGSSSVAPRSWLAIAFFDEQFRFIGEGNRSFRVFQSGNGAAPLVLSDVVVPRNGYAYIYLCNESAEPVYFDNFSVSHERGKLVEENHYYPYGLKIASLSSRKVGTPGNGQLQNRLRYQGSYSEENEYTGWNEFALRNYDPQIGRWLSGDPYNQFSSPYLGMGNNPVNRVDPDGGWTPGYNGINWLGLSGDLTGGQMILSRAINTAAGALAGGIANSAVNGWTWNNFGTGALWGGSAGFAATYVPWEEFGKSLGSAGKWVGELLSSDGDWMSLYKADLIRYANTENENILGATFEDLFGNFAKSDALMIASNVRRNIGKFTGGFRNTAPDFVGDAYVSEKIGTKRINTTIKGADWYELKQQVGGLYLSSNEDQIAGHIDNIRNSTDYAYKKYGRLGYQSKLYVVTTADVRYSMDIYERAFKNNVLYEHIHAEYKIKNNKWKFRFKKTTMTTQKW